MRDLVIQRLEALGFVYSNTYDYLLNWSIDKTTEHIKNFCNISNIPNNLQHHIVDVMCGDFLNAMYQSKQLNNDNFDLSTAVKQITEGDVSVTYALNEGSTSDEQKLVALIANLSNFDYSCLIKYRKLVW